MYNSNVISKVLIVPFCNTYVNKLGSGYWLRNFQKPGRRRSWRATGIAAVILLNAYIKTFLVLLIVMKISAAVVSTTEPHVVTHLAALLIII